MEDHVDFKKTGLKATIPRLRVLNIFENNREKHLSAEEIYKIMINNGEDIGLATIYRVLTQFEQAGLLLKHHFESGKAVYELNEESHHDHIVCLQCGHVVEFVDSEIEKRQRVHDLEKTVLALNEWFEKELNGYMSSKNVMTIPSGGNNE